MKPIHPALYHAILLAIAFVAAITINDGEFDFFKNLGAAFGLWVFGAIANRFGNRTMGIIVTIAFAYFSYIGR